MRRIAAVLMIGLAAACGGGGAGTDLTKPVDSTSVKVKIDPYATFFIENTTTTAAGKLNAPYFLYADILPDTLVNWGAVQPGEHGCTSMSGYVGDRTLQLVGVADTVTTLTDADAPKIALGSLVRAGTIVRKSIAFDPLVGADTSRGHTRTRPVMWRWTISDTAVTFREDSLSGCNFPP